MKTCVIIIGASFLFGSLGCAAEDIPASYELSVSSLIKQQSDGVVVIDIRRKEEWLDTGILNGAKTITAFTETGVMHPDFQREFVSVVPNSDTPFVLYCRAGRRSGILRFGEEFRLSESHASFGWGFGLEERG